MSHSSGRAEFRRWSCEVSDLFKFCCQIRSCVEVVQFIGGVTGGGIACCWKGVVRAVCCWFQRAGCYSHSVAGSGGEGVAECCSVRVSCPYTGGEGAFTQWVHDEFMVSSEAICPPNTHWVHAEYFSKEPINLLPLYPLGTG